MHCAACVERMKNALSQVPGVTSARVTLSPPAAEIESAAPIPMNALTDASPGSRGHVDPADLAWLIAQRDAQVLSGRGKDPQVVATAAARNFWVDRRIRVAPPRALTDPKDGPLLAVRLSVLTRKTLGGLWCDPAGRVLRPDGEVLDGLWAVGEAAGFGGGGAHGHRALEGTFLGGCLFTGRVTGRALAGSL